MPPWRHWWRYRNPGHCRLLATYSHCHTPRAIFCQSTTNINHILITIVIIIVSSSSSIMVRVRDSTWRRSQQRTCSRTAVCYITSDNCIIIIIIRVIIVVTMASTTSSSSRSRCHWIRRRHCSGHVMTTWRRRLQMLHRLSQRTASLKFDHHVFYSSSNLKPGPSRGKNRGGKLP